QTLEPRVPRTKTPSPHPLPQRERGRRRREVGGLGSHRTIPSPRCHPCESRDPPPPWTPASAGVTLRVGPGHPLFSSPSRGRPGGGAPLRLEQRLKPAIDQPRTVERHFPDAGHSVRGHHFSTALSRVALSGYSTQDSTIISFSLALTARKKSV